MKFFGILILLSISPQCFGASDFKLRVQHGRFASIQLISSAKEMAKFAATYEGVVTQRESGLGSNFEPMEIVGEGKVEAIIVDLNGDQVDEMILRSNWEVSSGVYVFQWNSLQKKYEVMPTVTQDDYLMFPKSATISFSKEKKILSVTDKNKTVKLIWVGKHFRPYLK
jgi:hypothetical protein